MERSPKDKTVVVTGGARGMGYSIADHFLKHGAKTVILLDVLEKEGAAAVENLAATHGSGRAVFIKCDITTDLETVSKKILDTYTTVDILVNNAGIINDQTWKRAMDVNATYLIGWSFKFWDHMRTDKGGKGGTIINIASILGYIINRYLPVYRASKFAVMGFTLSLGHVENYKKSGVRVVALCPGITETPILSETSAYDKEFFAGDMVSERNYPMQGPEAVGAAAVELFERDTSGTAWTIEGGQPISEVKYLPN